jgi:phosphonate transport system permease protein
MPVHTVPVLPEAQLEPLLRAYDEAVAARRRQLGIGIAIGLIAFVIAAFGAQVNVTKFGDNIANFFAYFGRLAHLDSGELVWTSPADWFWGLARWTRLLGETIMIAYVGTLTGAVIAFAGSFLCSRNLVASALLRGTVKRVLEFARTVPDIVFALIFVISFGLGALPGVLAIAVHTAGTLGKLFSEVVESIDMKPVEGVIATGGGWLSRVRYGVLPQVLSNYASYTLLRFEINVRGAAVIGFVGAGGIGQELIVAIRKFYYSDVSAILLMIIVTVMLIDFASEKLRHRLLASESRR